MTSQSLEKRISLDWTKVQDVFPIESTLAQSHQALVAAKRSLLEGNGKGNEARIGYG